ncbi:MAG: hypothetical protein ISR60_05425 [Anaerolineales bacterium]|nr:hypothetical protein [Anaerolineales bacterium]
MTQNKIALCFCIGRLLGNKTNFANWQPSTNRPMKIIGGIIVIIIQVAEAPIFHGRDYITA